MQTLQGMPPLTPAPPAKPYALHPLTSMHLPYRDGGHASPLPQRYRAQMQTGVLRPQAERWGPTPHPPPPWAHYTLATWASGQREIEARKKAAPALQTQEGQLPGHTLHPVHGAHEKPRRFTSQGPLLRKRLNIPELRWEIPARTPAP